MKWLWNQIEQKELPAQRKYTLLLRGTALSWSILGLALWLGLRFTQGAGLEALMILVGYPLCFSWIPVFFYTCRHPFASVH